MKENKDYKNTYNYYEDIENWESKHSKVKYIINGKKYFIEDN